MNYKPYQTGKILKDLEKELSQQLKLLPTEHRHIYDLPFQLYSNFTGLLNCFPSKFPGKAMTSFVTHGVGYCTNYFSLKPLGPSEIVRKTNT